MKRRFVPEAGELQHRPGRDQELENTPSVSLRSEVESLAEDASEVPDESEDAAAFTVIHDKQDSGPDVSSGSTDSAPVDSGLRSNQAPIVLFPLLVLFPLRPSKKWLPQPRRRARA